MSDAYRELVIRVRGDESSIKRTEAQIRSSLSSINIPVSVDAKRAVAETRNLKQALTEAGSAAERLGIELARGVKVTGEYILIRNAISNLLDVISDSTKQAIRFEFELAKIAQTVNKTNAQVQAYSGRIFDLSKSYGVTNIKIAETIRILTQAGLAFDDAARGAEILAKTTLLASFDDIESSTEAMIATMRTFNLTIGETEKAFEDIGVISKAYAVESADLVEAIKRAGGVFAATGGSVEELLALFTSVRQTTRESAETIATGFRTIFSRLQRPKTIQFFKELGIQLADTEGKFIGNYEAIEAINKGLAAQNIKPGSLKFAQIAEEIGGIRQISRVIPLLTKFSVAEEARQKAVSSGAESDRDAAKAKETLAFKLLELKQNFSNLLAEISQSNEFKFVANILLTMANAATELTRALVKLGPLLSVLGGSLGLRFASGVSRTVQGLPGRVFGLATGGIVPSEGNVAVKGAGTDTVPALLTPGEFVVNKASAQAYGYANLKRINRFAKGGPVYKETEREIKEASSVIPKGVKRPSIIREMKESLLGLAKQIDTEKPPKDSGMFKELADGIEILKKNIYKFADELAAKGGKNADFIKNIESAILDFSKEIPSDIQRMIADIKNSIKSGDTDDIEEKKQGLSEAKRSYLKSIKSDDTERAYLAEVQARGPTSIPTQAGLRRFAYERQSQTQPPNEKLIQALAEMRSIDTTQTSEHSDLPAPFDKRATYSTQRNDTPSNEGRTLSQYRLTKTPPEAGNYKVSNARSRHKKLRLETSKFDDLRTSIFMSSDMSGKYDFNRPVTSTEYTDFTKIPGKRRVRRGSITPKEIVSQTPKRIPINIIGQVADLGNQASQASGQYGPFRNPQTTSDPKFISDLDSQIGSIEKMKIVLSELAKEVPLLGGIKVSDIAELRAKDPEKYKKGIKGSGSGKGIHVDRTAGVGVGLHEAGHYIDKNLGLVYPKGQRKEPSTDESSLQGYLSRQFKDIVLAKELAGLKTLGGDGESHYNYRTKPTESFADLFARSPIQIQKILASTIDKEKGVGQLKELGFDPEDPLSFSKFLKPDFTRGVGVNRNTTSFPGTYRNIDPQFSPGVIVPPQNQAGFGGFAKFTPPTPKGGFGGFGAFIPPTSVIDDLVDQALAGEGGGKPPKKTRNKSGDGFRGDCCEKIVKAINNIYDLLKSGNVKVAGSAKEKPESGPVEEMVDIEKAVERGTVQGYRVGGLAKAAFSAAAALQVASLAAKQIDDTGVVSDIGRVVESAIGPLTTAAVALGSVSELSNFLGRLKPSEFFGRGTSQEVYGPFPSRFQGDKESFGKKLSTEDIVSFDKIASARDNRIVTRNRGAIGGLGQPTIIKNRASVVGRKGGWALDYAGTVGRRAALTPSSGGLSRLFDSTFSRLGGAGTARAAGLAGGAGVLAGQLLGRGVDALRNTSGRRDIAIKEGNISEARDLAGTAQVEKDLTNLSSAVLGASFAIASVTGPAAPFVVAAGLGAAVLIKSADQMAESQNKYVAGFGKAILDITKNARDFLSSQGLADSSGLIRARAAELASIENFTKIIDDNVPRLKKAIENITTRDLTKKETLEQAASGQAINDILSGFNRRRVAQLQAREARSANISRLNEAQINDESLLTSIVPRAFVPNIVASTANESQEGVLSFFGKGKAASSTRLVDENKAADEAFRKDQETSLESIRNLAEQAANRVLKSGGALDEKTLREELIKLNKGFGESKILEGGPANKLLTEVASLANINKVFGNFNESLKEATKATLEFRSGLFDFTVSRIQGKFENESLGSVSKVQNLRDRTKAFEDLLIQRQQPIGLSLRDRVIKGSEQSARLAVAARADEQLSGEKEAELNASQLALDTAALKEQVELRKELMGSIKAEIEVEKRRVSAISDSLTALAIGSKEERKQAEKTIKIAQLLQQGADVGSLSSKQKALIPGALKFLDEDQQEKIRQRILGIGANRARALGVSGNLAGNIAQVGTTGSTQTEKDLINKVQTQYEEMRKDQEALLNGQKAIAEVMNAEFNRVSLQLQETLNNNKFIDAVNMLGQIQDIKITMPENFTVDLTNVNTLMEGVTNAITAEVGRQIQSLKNGIQ